MTVDLWWMGSGGLEDQLAQLLANLAGLGVRLLGQVAGGDGEALLDGGQRGLDAADDLLDGLVDVLDPLGDLAAHVAEVPLDRRCGR